MATDPELCEELVEKIRQRGTVRADTLPELKHELGMDHVSNTQFGRALRKLHHKLGLVDVYQPTAMDMRPRPYTVTALA